MSRTDNSLNLAKHSVSSRVTHTDPHNWTRPDPLSKENRPEPTRPVDGPVPCPILSYGLSSSKINEHDDDCFSCDTL